MVVFTLFFVCIMVGQVFSQTGLTTDDKQVILDAHNMFRGSVDPTASNMLAMVSEQTQ